MDIIVDIIVPVFGIVGIGYVAARVGLFSAEATRGLSAFVFNFAIPALLFRTMVTTKLPAVLEWSYLVAYFGGVFGVWIIGTLISRYVLRRSGAAPAIAGMTAGFSNNVLLGVPLVLTTFGEAATLPLVFIIACDSWLLLSTVTVQAELAIGKRGSATALLRNVANGLARNPIIMALIVGIIWNVFGLPFPSFADTLTETLGRAAMPCAVFAMGAALAGFRLSGAAADAGVGVSLKLVAHPLLVWLLATYVFELEPLWRDVATVMAALPAGVNVYLVADRYQSGVAGGVTAILISTALSVASIAVVLTMLGVR